MKNSDEIARKRAKTFEQHFLRVLQQEFDFAPRIAQAILDEAESCLVAPAAHLKAGQRMVLLAERKAGHGQAMSQTPTKRVRWTVDAGAEDQTVQSEAGSVALRRVRIQRLLSEALEQGAVATQEDIASALAVNVRTIKRDFKALQAQGITLPSRGYVHGIGRGQTHKSQIVGRWLAGETYDQISLHTYHTVASIRRYVQTFVRVVALAHQGFSVGQIAHLSQCSHALVREYLALYENEDDPFCRKRLQEQVERLQCVKQGHDRAKKGAL
jgi:hypothetical protein